MSGIAVARSFPLGGRHRGCGNMLLRRAEIAWNVDAPGCRLVGAAQCGQLHCRPALYNVMRACIQYVSKSECARAKSGRCQTMG